MGIHLMDHKIRLNEPSAKEEITCKHKDKMQLDEKYDDL